MAMESLEVESSKVKSLCDDSMKTSVNESESLGVDFLADLDSIWQDLDDRLIVSRMVSDSVIKGMVSAVTKEAAEKIAQKELEVVELKEVINAHSRGVNGTETESQLGSKCMVNKVHSSFSEAATKHKYMRGTLGNLRSACKEQFVKLRKEINQVKGCGTMERGDLGSELLGFGGMLHEQPSKSCCEVDTTVNGLETTLETVLEGVEEVVHLSEASLHEWNREQEFRAGIEALVMGNCIRSLEQEFEGKLWDRICSEKAINWSGRMTEISSLREELNSISKSLCVTEPAHLISHGSLDSDGWKNGKRSHFHHNILGNHVENGKCEHPQNDKQENSDPNYLSHLTRDELVVYYNNEMTKLKRHHESKVQEMTEEYFSLKREYLKEKGSSLVLKKDKEFITLRKRIPEVILKLDDILVETEKIPVLFEDREGLSSLKDRLETLLAENRQLRDFLSEKKKEVKCLATQVSDASDQMSHQSWSEAKLLNTIRNLKSTIEDLHIEGLICSDVFSCLLREMTGQIQRSLESSHAEYNEVRQHYESVMELSDSTQPASKCGIEDSDMLSVATQDFLEVIYREAWKEAKHKHDALTMAYMGEIEVRVSLEKEALEKNRMLETELADRKRLEHEMHILAEEKERLAQDSAALIQSEKERVRLADEEIEKLKIQQQILLSESAKESDVRKCELTAAMKEVELYKLNLGNVNEKLGQAVKEFRKADEEKRKLLVITQEKGKAISLHEAREREVRNQMESMAAFVQGVSRASSDFEYRVTNSISKNCSRLNNLKSQSRLLIQKADILKRTGALYKRRFDKRFSDLQKAEAEVDLLGDEVDTLLSLLEKIYLALDHYSPVLQHYPGIIDTLKLVKRELTGLSKRSA